MVFPEGAGVLRITEREKIEPALLSRHVIPDGAQRRSGIVFRVEHWDPPCPTRKEGEK